MKEKDIIKKINTIVKREIKNKLTENHYITYQKEKLLSSDNQRFNILAFIQVINIAFYSGIYHVMDKQPWFINWQSLTLCLILITINFLITFIYIREYNLNKIRWFLFKEYSKNSKEFKKWDEKFTEKDKNRKGTWISLKIIFSLFNTIPFTYLIIIISNEHINFIKQCLKLFSVIYFIMLFIIIFLILNCLEIDDLDKS